MRNIINVILTYLVLFFTTKYFPEFVSVTGTKELIITNVILFVLDIVFSLLLILMISMLMGVLFTVGKNENSIFFLIFSIIVSLAWTPLKLYLVSTFYEPFTIANDWRVYLLLTMLLGFFTVKAKKNNK